jgi:hypothetical protein
MRIQRRIVLRRLDGLVQIAGLAPEDIRVSTQLDGTLPDGTPVWFVCQSIHERYVEWKQVLQTGMEPASESSEPTIS